MRRSLPALFVFSILFGATALVAGKAPQPAAIRDARPARVRPDGNRALAHVRLLASDEFRGRRSGTVEYRKAAEYVADRFKEYGLQPAGDNGTWFQEVEMKDYREFAQPTRLEITSPRRRAYFAGYDRDFRPVSGSGSGIVSGRLAFAGYGVVSPTAGWNDYDGLDARGRVVMILPGAPPGVGDAERKEWTIEKKVATAVARGAAGLIEMDLAIPGRSLATVARPTGSIQAKDACPEGFVVIRATGGFCDDAFYLAGKSWRYHASRMLREARSAPLAIETTVEMEVHAVRDDRTAPNVIGVMPGTDPRLKDEYLILGGHLDHEGVDIDGFVYSGADDDASSTGTILEVIRTLSANGFRPRRTLVFCAWMGEELGLVGSAWYANHPRFPLDKTALYLNIDMVGTGDTDLWVGGLYEFAELYDILRAGLDPEVQKKLHPRFQYRGSDHTSFSRKGVPWVSLRSGNPLTPELDDEHPEYHRPGDRPEYIRPELLELAADYHYQILTHLANTDTRLVDPRFFTGFIHRDTAIADMHCDTISRFMEGEDLRKDLPTGHIDIPKLKRGSVDLQVFATYVPAPRTEKDKFTAATRIFNQIDAVHAFVSQNPDDLGLVLKPSDLPPLMASNKAGVLIAIEGGYAIENSLGLLRAFYQAGVRLMTLTHWNRTDWADASGDEKAELGGLTEFGEQVVREMNRLGMIVDLSHVHDETFWDVLRVSTKPVVASHSCARGLSDHFRNLSDDMLTALAKNGGVVGINFAPGFLKAELETLQTGALAVIARKYGIPESQAAWNNVDPAVRAKVMAELEAKTAEFERTVGVVDVGTVVDHIDRIVKVTGSADHVGLGSDYDGIGAPPRGLENIGKIMAVTAELKARGYKEEDIRKIMGENFVRVFRAVSQVAAR